MRFPITRVDNLVQRFWRVFCLYSACARYRAIMMPSLTRSLGLPGGAGVSSFGAHPHSTGVPWSVTRQFKVFLRPCMDVMV